MRFAITAVDRNFGLVESLLELGWEPIKLFTAPTDNKSDFNGDIINRAEKLGLPIQISEMLESDLANLADQQCDVLVCGSYNWRIPDWRPYLPHAVNFHPSPLPFGRGPDPTVRAILDNWGEWAVTCHKLSEKFDRGDILATEYFSLDDDESRESLRLKVQMASRRLGFRVALNFSNLWEAGIPQVGGDYWGWWTDDDRRIDFKRSVSAILRQVRAFGSLETIALVDGAKLLVTNAVGWREPHAHRPGSLIFASHDKQVIAAADGYVGLLEWRLDPSSPRRD